MNRDYQTARVEDRGEGLLLLTLNRPEFANAMNTQMGRDLLAFFDEINAAPSKQRCIVLTGAGERAFCAGGDLKERNGMTDEAWQDQHLLFERMIRAFIGCPVPVIGAVNGAAYAGGCELALCCDFVYAAETARFALTEVTLGIMPGAGGTQNLPRAVGERRAKEIILTGRPFTAARGVEARFTPSGHILGAGLVACEIGGRRLGPVATERGRYRRNTQSSNAAPNENPPQLIQRPAHALLGSIFAQGQLLSHRAHRLRLEETQQHGIAICFRQGGNGLIQLRSDFSPV